MNNEHKPLTTPWLYLDEILKEEVDFFNGSQTIFGGEMGKTCFIKFLVSHVLPGLFMWSDAIDFFFELLNFVRK